MKKQINHENVENPWKNQHFWNCPGSIQRHPGVTPEHLGGHFAAQKPPLTVFSETLFFLQPGRLLAPLGVSRGRWTSPLGPRGGFTSSTWCEALFLNFGIFQKQKFSNFGQHGNKKFFTYSFRIQGYLLPDLSYRDSKIIIFSF